MINTGYCDSSGREIQLGDILEWCGHKYEVMETYWTSDNLEKHNHYAVKRCGEGLPQINNLYCFLKVCGRYGVNVVDNIGEDNGKL